MTVISATSQNQKISPHSQALLQSAIVWDNHACMLLRPEDEPFLPQLARHKAASASVVFLNIYMDLNPPEAAFAMLAEFRRWIDRHSEDHVLAQRDHTY